MLGEIISHQSITKTRVKSHCEHCGDDSYVRTVRVGRAVPTIMTHEEMKSFCCELA